MRTCGQCRHYLAPVVTDEEGNTSQAPRGACNRFPPTATLVGYTPSSVVGGKEIPNALNMIPQVGAKRKACGEFHRERRHWWQIIKRIFSRSK